MCKRDFWKILERRKKRFAEFQDKGYCLFKKYHDLNKKIRHKESQKFDDVYFFTICPKGRWGGNADDIFQVFYGNRISGHEEGTKTNENGETRRYFKNFIESGVVMNFYLEEQGLVTVFLRAAKDENQEDYKMEDGIIVGRRVPPYRLLRKRIVRKYWKILFSYMEYTSKLGEPNLFDKVRYYWYIKHKGYVVEKGNIERRKLTSNLIRILIYLLTTTISFLLAIGLAFLVFKLGWV